MGKMATAVCDGREYTLSLVEWGPARKLQYAALMKLGAVNKYEQPDFIPACEIAIYDAWPDDLLSDRSKLSKPSLIFYYRNLALAEEKMGVLQDLVKAGGDCGKPMSEYVRNGNPLNEFVWTPPVSQLIDDITEKW